MEIVCWRFGENFATILDYMQDQNQTSQYFSFPFFTYKFVS